MGGVIVSFVHERADMTASGLAMGRQAATAPPLSTVLARVNVLQQFQHKACFDSSKIISAKQTRNVELGDSQ